MDEEMDYGNKGREFWSLFWIWPIQAEDYEYGTNLDGEEEKSEEDGIDFTKCAIFGQVD